MDIQQYKQSVEVLLERSAAFVTRVGYPAIAAAAFLPVLVEYSQTPSTAFNTLVAILGGIGGNLIANLVQNEYDYVTSLPEETALEKLADQLTTQIAHDEEFSQAIAILIERSAALHEINQIVSRLPLQWDEFSERLLEQVRSYGGTRILIESLQINLVPDANFARRRGLLLDYLDGVSGDTEQLRLGTIDPSFEIDSPLKLSQVFVSPHCVEVGGNSAGNRTRSRKNPVELIRSMYPRVGRTNRGLVILGGPGAGKSSLVDRLSNAMALVIVESIEQHYKDADVDVTIRQNSTFLRDWSTPYFLPVRVNLQDFAARGIPEHVMNGYSGLIWEYIKEILKEKALSDFAPILEQILSGWIDFLGNQREQRGTGGIVFFDGLDEVPFRKRRIVDQSIANFSDRFANSIVVVTCRSYSWSRRQTDRGAQDLVDPLEEWKCVELAQFSTLQIKTFVEQWYNVIRSTLKHMTIDMMQHRISTLLDATSRGTLAALASKPLLLTLMASLHTSRGKLPHDRAALYSDCVELLLDVWQRDKDLHWGGHVTVEGGLLEEFGLTSDRVERALRKVAYEMHAAGDFGRLDNDERRREVTVNETQLLTVFRPLVRNSLDEAERLVSYIQRRAGLLEYEGDGAYRFPHRTFQEYLAACYLLDLPDSPKQLIEHLYGDPNWWGEVFSLAVGRQSRVAYSQAIYVLMDAYVHSEKCGTQKVHVIQQLLNAARDIGLASRQYESRIYSELLRDMVLDFAEYATESSLRNLDSQSVFADVDNVLRPYLVPALGERRYWKGASSILSEFGRNELIAEIQPLLGHKDDFVRCGAYRVLGRLGNAVTVQTFSECLANEKSPGVISEILRALGHLGGDIALEILLDHLDSANQVVRAAAEDALKRIDAPSTVDRLRDILDGEDSYDVARRVIRILQSIADTSAIFCLIGLVSDDDLAPIAERALLEIGSTVEDLVRQEYNKSDVWDYEAVSRFRRILRAFDIREEPAIGDPEPLYGLYGLEQEDFTEIENDYEGQPRGHWLNDVEGNDPDETADDGV